LITVATVIGVGLAGIGIEAAAATPIRSMPSAASEAFGGASPSHHGLTCILPAGYRPGRRARAGATLASSGQSAQHRGSGSGGTLVVSVPRTVFIRSERRWLFVTTNTGSIPARDDEFFLIAAGRATLASAWLERAVIAGCAAEARAHRPHRG
jgi:hypothetical protein